MNQRLKADACQRLRHAVMFVVVTAVPIGVAFQSADYRGQAFFGDNRCIRLLALKCFPNAKLSIQIGDYGDADPSRDALQLCFNAFKRTSIGRCSCSIRCWELHKVS